MSGSKFLPMGRVGEAIVGLTMIPTLVYENKQWVGIPTRRGVSVRDRIARREANPEHAAQLKRARNSLGTISENLNAGRQSLATLRLRAGLSQTQLAAMMGTQQGNVSRWESDPAGLQAATLVKLAKALGVASSVVLEVVESSFQGA